MKTLQIIIALALLVPVQLLAQKGGRVTYSVSLNSNLIKNVSNREAVLTYNETSALFDSSIEYNMIVNWELLDSTSTQRPLKGAQASYSCSSNFSSISSNTLITKEKHPNQSCESIYSSEDFGAIKWTVHTDKKKVGKYTCTRATGSFKGRSYEAWFTDKIKVPFGPWKLNGLPGLILEAYDTERFLVFEYVSHSKSAVASVVLDLPANEKLYNPQEVIAMRITQIKEMHKESQYFNKSGKEVKYNFSHFVERDGVE